MKVLDLFSGIGGFSLGLERAGMQTIAFCEIDPYCRRVLAKHWPMVPAHDDITTRKFKRGEADVICGGFPCQDVSSAGKRAGLSGKRSGLYRELVRAIRVVRSRYAILENVAALLNDGMGRVLGDLAESGVDTEWDCIPACALGAPHERDRVFIVAHTDGVNGRSPDSFARVRDEARRNAADPCGARYAFREGLGRDAWEELTPAQRSALQDGRQSIWPDEPALSGMDDDVPDWVERTKATGNALLPLIPELIGRALMAAEVRP